MRQIENILGDINTFEPTNGNWLILDDLLNELWAAGQPELGIVTMLKVLERFPKEDGAGVLWSIVHGLEHIGGYEQQLLDSLYRQPSHLSVTMVYRIENSGQTKIQGKEITTIYNELLEISNMPNSVREEINDYCRRRAGGSK